MMYLGPYACEPLMESWNRGTNLVFYEGLALLHLMFISTSKLQTQSQVRKNATAMTDALPPPFDPSQCTILAPEPLNPKQKPATIDTSP